MCVGVGVGDAKCLLSGGVLTCVVCVSLLVLAPAVRGGGAGKPVPRAVTSDGVLYGKRLKDLSQLANDDELAAEEAAAQGGIPGAGALLSGCVCWREAESRRCWQISTSL